MAKKITYFNENNQEKLVTDEMIQKQEHYATAYLSSNQSITQGHNNVAFNKSEVHGDYFDFKNNEIIVKKKCVAMLSGSAFVDGSTGDGYVWAKITVNGLQKNNHLERIINRDYTMTSLPSAPVQLNVGDIITMTVEYTSSNGSLRSGAYVTFMAVTKI